MSRKQQVEQEPSLEEQELNVAEEGVEEGYACSCGFVSQDKDEFTSHVMLSARRDGKGTHKSLGRINLETGEVLVPPWAGRDLETQKKSKAIKKTVQPPSNKGNGQGKTSTSGQLADAQTIRVIPRVYTMDYSPIMRAAQEAAIRYWGWRQDMPLGNFIDTCLYLFFEEKGITLCGYIVSEELLQKEGNNNAR